MFCPSYVDYSPSIAREVCDCKSNCVPIICEWYIGLFPSWTFKEIGVEICAVEDFIHSAILWQSYCGIIKFQRFHEEHISLYFRVCDRIYLCFYYCWWVDKSFYHNVGFRAWLFSYCKGRDIKFLFCWCFRLV